MENWQEWTVHIRMRHALNKEHNYCDKKLEGRVGWGKKIPKTGTIKTFWWQMNINQQAHLNNWCADPNQKDAKV